MIKLYKDTLKKHAHNTIYTRDHTHTHKRMRKQRTQNVLGPTYTPAYEKKNEPVDRWYEYQKKHYTIIHNKKKGHVQGI